MARLDFGVYLLWTKPHDSCLQDIGFQYNRVEWWFRWALCYHLLKLIVGSLQRAYTRLFWWEKGPENLSNPMQCVEGPRMLLVWSPKGCWDLYWNPLGIAKKKTTVWVWQLNMAGKSPIFQIFPMATLHGWGISHGQRRCWPSSASAAQVGASFRTELSPWGV